MFSEGKQVDGSISYSNTIMWVQLVPLESFSIVHARSGTQLSQTSHRFTVPQTYPSGQFINIKILSLV